MAHTTILRWVQRYVPEFEKRWSRYARPVGDSRRVDETYIKVRGEWVYLCRAVDKPALGPRSDGSLGIVLSSGPWYALPDGSRIAAGDELGHVYLLEICTDRCGLI